MKPVGAKPKPAEHTSQNAGDEGRMGRGLRDLLEGEIHTSGDSGATLGGHRSYSCVLMPNMEEHRRNPWG